MKTSTKSIILLCIICIAFNTKAQQVIVTDSAAYTTPASGAMLDVYSTKKGFMPPRVGLTSLTDVTTIPSPAAGLMVYNTGARALKATGIYYWNGSIWSKPLTGGTGGTNTMNIADDGTVTLSGEATTWNDLLVNPATARNSGGLVPTWTVFVAPNVYTWMFADSKSNEVDFSVQMPHDYKEGSDIYPHIHWSSTAAGGLGRVKWVMDYQWVNFGDSFLATGNTNVYGTQLAEDNTVSLTAFQTTITPMNTGGVSGAGITGTGKKISSILLCHLYREGANTDDTFSGTAALLSIDFHYEIDSFGSRDKFVK